MNDYRFCPDCWSPVQHCSWELLACGLLDYECKLCDKIFDIEETLDAAEVKACSEHPHMLIEYIPSAADKAKLDKWNKGVRDWK